MCFVSSGNAFLKILDGCSLENLAGMTGYGEGTQVAYRLSAASCGLSQGGTGEGFPRASRYGSCSHSL